MNGIAGIHIADLPQLPVSSCCVTCSPSCALPLPLQPFIESWTYNTHTVNVVLGYCEQGDLAGVLLKRKVL